MIPLLLALFGATQPADTSATMAVNRPDSAQLGAVVVNDTTPTRKAYDTAAVDLSARPDAPAKIELKGRIEEAYLYWKTLYTIYLSNDGVSVIEPPIGFTFESAVIGNGKLFAVQNTHNRITVKKLAFNDVSTTLILMISGPDGNTNSVAIDVRAGSNSSSLVRFVIPTTREVSRVVEQVRARYIDQMNSQLKVQEKTLARSVWEEAILQQDVFRIPEHLSSTEDEWKGAHWRLVSVVNSRDEAFIVTSTDANDRECQVVDLLGVQDADGVIKKHVELMGKRRSSDGKRTELIYRTSRMTPGKWVFRYSIWSREFQMKTRLELGEVE